jgi:hypothetical protein
MLVFSGIISVQFVPILELHDFLQIFKTKGEKSLKVCFFTA